MQVPDVLSDPEYEFKDAASIGGYRTGLGVPLMRKETPIGVVFVTRDRVLTHSINNKSTLLLPSPIRR